MLRLAQVTRDRNRQRQHLSQLNLEQLLETVSSMARSKRSREVQACIVTHRTLSVNPT